MSQAQNLGYGIDETVHASLMQLSESSVGTPMDVQVGQHDSAVHAQGFSCQKRGADDHDITL